MGVVKEISSLFGQNGEGKLVHEVFFKDGGTGQIHVFAGRFTATLQSKDKAVILTKVLDSERDAKNWLVKHQGEHESEVS